MNFESDKLDLTSKSANLKKFLQYETLFEILDSMGLIKESKEYLLKAMDIEIELSFEDKQYINELHGNVKDNWKIVELNVKVIRELELLSGERRDCDL